METEDRFLLPPFDEYGYLPPGIHPCDVDELVVRFGGGSPERAVETKELLDFLDWAHQSDVQRVIINGSYVTAELTPNDVDVVILPGVEYKGGIMALSRQELQWPFLHIFVAEDESDLEAWAVTHFGTDRNLLAKGVIEVQL